MNAAAIPAGSPGEGNPPPHSPPPALRRRGRYVVVAGPDGTGKSAVAAALIDGALAAAPTLHLHHRPRVLGGLTNHEGPVTEPHRDEPYPGWLSAGKTVYLFLDYLFGWVLRLRPALQRGEHVVLERGWWDLVVDPRRYRLRGKRLASLLGRLLPQPDLTVVLGGPAATILRRSAELSEAELERQLRAWEDMPVPSVHIDVSRPLDSVVQAAASALADVETSDRWIGLPNPGTPRWWLPRSPRRVAAAGLSVYTPVTRRGFVGWHVAQRLAALGLFSLLPDARRPPPPGLLDLLLPHLPPGSRIAIARATHEHRLSALIIDPRGRPISFAKVALNGEGRAALDAEARAMSVLRAHCHPPLRMPDVLATGPGVLVMSVARRRALWRPWRLPVPVARALGRLYAAGAEDDGLGYAHGDCAPWNLLAGRDGTCWSLVDWSDGLERHPPFHDPLHYLVQACALLGRPPIGEVLAALDGEGPSGRSLLAYADAAGVPLTAARGTLVALLEAHAMRTPSDRADEVTAARVRAEMLRALRSGPPR